MADPKTEQVHVRVIDADTSARHGEAVSGIVVTRTPGADADHAEFTFPLAAVSRLLRRAKGPKVLAIHDEEKSVWLAVAPPVVSGETVTVSCKKKGT